MKVIALRAVGVTGVGRSRLGDAVVFPPPQSARLVCCVYDRQEVRRLHRGGC